jgi:hypothetical protein
MAVYSATVEIDAVSSAISGPTRRRNSTVVISSQSSDTQSGIKEAKGQGSSSIRSNSSVAFGSGIGSVYQVTTADTYRISAAQSLDYDVKPAQGINVVSQAHASIQANTWTGVNFNTSFKPVIALGAASNVLIQPFFIKGEIAPGSSQYQASTITLGSGDRGDITTATISPQRWSDFSGLRTGFRIYSGDKQSIAIVLQDPQYRNDTIQIQIIEPFFDLVLYLGNWHIDVPEGTNFNDPQYTPNYFRASDILSATMKDFKKFVVEPVQYQTERMRDFRRWDRVDSEFLSPLARTMGMNIRLDRMDREARRRAIHEWTGFCQYAGTEAFIDFEGYSIDTIFSIEHLWTNDYKNFIVKDPGITYPAYYPTNHVALRYDANVWDITNSEDLRYIYETFYQLASVPLVLQYIYTLVQDTTQLWVQAVSHESEHAPVEGNDLPPNFWIVAVAADVYWAPHEENVLPPNFFLAAVELDVIYVSDYVVYGDGI